MCDVRGFQLRGARTKTRNPTARSGLHNKCGYIDDKRLRSSIRGLKATMDRHIFRMFNLAWRPSPPPYIDLRGFVYRLFVGIAMLFLERIPSSRELCSLFANIK